VLIIADIDAIPLNEWVVGHMVELAISNGLCGHAQSTSHIGDYDHVFVAPSFMAINVADYRAVGSPSFEPSYRGDVAQEVTYAFQRDGYKPCFMYPIHFESPPVPVRLPDGRISNPPYWETNGRKYGLNTTFSFTDLPDSFHGFQSSHEQQNRFIQKCMEVIG